MIIVNILLHKNLISYVTKFCCKIRASKFSDQNDIPALVKKTDFDDKVKNLNKKVTSNKTKHIEAEKKITDLTNKVT